MAVSLDVFFLCVRVAVSLFHFFSFWCIRNRERGAVISPLFSSDVFPFMLYNLGWGIFDKFRPGKEIEIARKPLLQLQ